MLVSVMDMLWLVMMACIAVLPIIFIIKAAKGSGTSEVGYYLLVLVSLIGILGIVFKGLDMGNVLDGLSKEFTWTIYIGMPTLTLLLLAASLSVWDDYYYQKERNELLKKIEKSLAYYANDGDLYNTINKLQERMELLENEVEELTEATTSPKLLSA